MKCSVCEEELDNIDEKEVCLYCFIEELKFSEIKLKISDIAGKLGVSTFFINEFITYSINDRKFGSLNGKIEDGYYLSQTYLKELYQKKLKNFKLEHTNILEEELNRQEFYRNNGNVEKPEKDKKEHE